MANVTGAVRMKANGEEYTLHMGTSVLAELQGIHGQDVLSQLEPPEGAPKGWMPDLQIVHDLFRFSLERHHGSVDRYTVDDLIAQNDSAFGQLMLNSLPEADPSAAGNAPAPAKRRR